MNKLITKADYFELIEKIGNTYSSAKNNISKSINTEMLLTYWKIGKEIIEYEQNGNMKADYGKQLLSNLSKDLSVKFGKGFSRSNLQNMRLLYHRYPKCQTLSGKLTWSPSLSF